MTRSLGTWTFALDGGDPPARNLIGGKAWSVARMRALGLDVPPAFVVTTGACVAFLESGRFPAGLEDELARGIAWLEGETGRRFGFGPRPLFVSVRSGAAISMPGMMNTVLNLGMTGETEAALAAECNDPAFARDAHRRFLELYADVVAKAPLAHAEPDADPATIRGKITAAGGSVPEDVVGQLGEAVRAVFESWNSRRARRYRQHNAIPDTLGTAVTVQAMVFGNVDERSGTGVLFSRNPLTGDPKPFGEYLARAQGEDVVSGKFTPKPLATMRDSAAEALDRLLAAATSLERENREAQDIEFTVERGRLYLLQSRGAKLAPQAAVRIAVDMVREGLIDEATALSRIDPEQVRLLLSPRLEDGATHDARVLATGEGACPGVGIGLVVGHSDEAEAKAAEGQSVVLARPTTSPEDLHGMIAAKAIVTEQGGSTSHAAVVSRALGVPCVVGCGAGALVGLEGRTVTIDGQSGRVFEGALAVTVPDESADEALRTIHAWAERRSPLRVVAASPAPDAVFDLNTIDAASDPARIAGVMAGLKGYRGATGGAIATSEGIRAAIEAGFEFVVANPVLPALLAAARAVGAANEAKGRGVAQ
jgi:pyruvate,orthophosphate dikinase